jgi:hypothetical protein
MEIDFLPVDSITQEPRIESLRKIKNEITASVFAKQYYFDQGILELVLPRISKDAIAEELTEMLAIINSYFFFE